MGIRSCMALGSLSDAPTGSKDVNREARIHWSRQDEKAVSHVKDESCSVHICASHCHLLFPVACFCPVRRFWRLWLAFPPGRVWPLVYFPDRALMTMQKSWQGRRDDCRCLCS